MKEEFGSREKGSQIWHADARGDNAASEGCRLSLKTGKPREKAGDEREKQEGI